MPSPEPVEHAGAGGWRWRRRGGNPLEFEGDDLAEAVAVIGGLAYGVELALSDPGNAETRTHHLVGKRAEMAGGVNRVCEWTPNWRNDAQGLPHLCRSVAQTGELRLPGSGCISGLARLISARRKDGRAA